MVFLGADFKPSSSAASITYHKWDRDPAHWTTEVNFGHVYILKSMTHAHWEHRIYPPCNFCLCSYHGRRWGKNTVDHAALQLDKATEFDRSRSLGWPSRTLTLLHLLTNTEDSETVTRAAGSSPALCSRQVIATNGERQRRYSNQACAWCSTSPDSTVPFISSFVTRFLQNKRVSRNKKHQFRTILAALCGRLHWMSSPVCGPWGLCLAKGSAHIK